MRLAPNIKITGESEHIGIHGESEPCLNLECQTCGAHYSAIKSTVDDTVELKKIKDRK